MINLTILEKRTKKQSTNWEKIYVKNISDKRYCGGQFCMSTGPGVSRLNIYLGMSARVFANEINIRIGGFNKVD